jgi:hypothetical protein
MPYVRDSFWRGREFTCLDAMRADAASWCVEVAGARACRPLDGAAPAAVFAAVEQQALGPLPTAPFVLAGWASAKIGPDIHAKVGATLYLLPWRYLGERVDARSTTTTMVQFFRHGELIKTRPRKERGKQTDLSDYPPEKIAFHMRTPTWCRRQAAEIGPAATAVIGELLADNALFRLRAAQGVLGLADRHDPARLEAACAKATAAGDPSYRTIKGILAAGSETTATPRPNGDAGAPAHLHGPDQLFADTRHPRRPTRRGRHQRCRRRRHPPAHRAPRRHRAHPHRDPRSRPHGHRRQHADQQRGRLVITEPASQATTDQAASDPAPLLTTTTTTAAATATATATGGPTDHVTAGEIAEFLHHLARYRSPALSGDPADRATLLARKTDPFTRIADPHAHTAPSPPSTTTPDSTRRAHPMNTPIIDNNALTASLRALKLGGMLQTLDARLAQARAGELGHLEFLQVLCHDEITRRETTAIARRTRRARFEETLTLEGFDFTAAPKLPAAQIRDLAALRWLQAGESVILYGPVGTG